jgi:mono/diheme cytochrome c family protein
MLRLRLSLAALVVAFFGLLAAAPPEPKSVKDLAVQPPVKAAPPVPVEKGQVHPAPNGNDAIRVAMTDARAGGFLGANPFVRYLWVKSEDEEDFKATVLNLNYISRSSFIYQPTAVPVPGSLLVRIDLRALFPRPADLADVLKVWEEFAFDPQFSLLLTKDVLELSGIAPELLPRVKRRGVRKDLQPPEKGEIPVEVLTPFDEEVDARTAGVDVIRLDAPDIDSAAFSQLRAVTFSQAPIVESRYFLFRALSTIKDDGAYRTIFGGLYYDLRGIKKAKAVKGKEKATDEDLFFEQLGIGSIAAGETYEKLLDRVRGDIRPSLFISDVTGKPRSVVAFHTPAEREGQSFGAVTWDIRDKDIDVRSHPVLSQIKPVIAAQEAIFPTANGMPIFALFNGQGALQDEAPPDVVADRAIPAPHTTRLQGAISCIRCHGPNETWQPIKDDLAPLLRSGRLAIFGELRADVADSQDRLVGLHTGSPDRLLSRARDDFAATVLKATGPWKRLAGDQSNVAKAAAAKIADIFGGYFYTPVDSRAALWDSGLDVPTGDAPAVLTKLLAAGDPVLGLSIADPREEQLAAGGKIGRRDFALRRSFLAGKVQKGVARLIQEGKKP